MMKKIGNLLLIVKENDTYTLSMTEQLQEDVGDIGFVEFNSDNDLEEDDSIVSIEASKTVLEIVTPLGGTVVERNLAAEDKPHLLNSDRAEDNWLVKLTNIDSTAFEALADAE
ncbi:glycine cleavage system protein H [Aerococcaceae bacterium WGS1372]